MCNKKMIAKAISTVLAFGLVGASSSAIAEIMDYEPGPGMEKCYGVARAGRNDCGAGSYKCAGESKVDGDREAWINMPTGLCNRLVGGTTRPPNKK